MAFDRSAERRPRQRVDPYVSPALFTSRETWDPTRIGALVMYCSDGRWGEAFDEFCHHRLHVPRYDRWAVPGGAAWIVAAAADPEAHQAAWEQLDFLAQAHDLTRLVLMTHYGCAYYGERLHQEPDECLPVQLDDLCTAAAVLRERFPAMTIETYLAMRWGVLLSLHRVEG